jgi:hypothetical protein
MPLSQEDIAALCAGFAPVLRQFVTDTVEKHIAGMLVYKGIWGEDEEYPANSLVTHHGAGWLAVKDNTGIRPGSNPETWRLVIKSDESRLRKLIKEEISR